MNILLLETATATCSVGLLQAGDLQHEITGEEDFMHASHLTLFIQQLLEAAQMDYSSLQYIALSNGPGSYTSLRVGAATAKGLCMALPGLQLLAVDTLSSLALAAVGREEARLAAFILPTIESRKEEVYTRVFDASGKPLTAVSTAVFPAERFETYRQQGPLLFCGSGTQRVKDFLGEAEDLIYLPDLQCRAAHLAAPALALAAQASVSDMATYEPFYLKPPFVTKSTKRLL